VATKVVHVSDLSGQQADPSELGRLVVREHPAVGEPVTLEVLPAEVERLKAIEQAVRVEYFAPGSSRPQTLTVALADFNALAEGEDMETVLRRALIAAHGERGRGRGTRGRVATRGRSGRGGRTNYASPEHAGEPHRGRITEAEKEYVRANLAEVNARLAAKGLRTIDPGNREHAERYGLKSS
jgi:hypothetical protein